MKEVIRQKLIETKRHIILEEVSAIFEREGFSGVRMQDIARRVGISVGALYKLFDSKEALYDAYVDYQIQQFHDALQETCKAEEDPKKCLQTFVRIKMEAFRQKRKAIEDPIVGDPLFFLKMNIHHHRPAGPIFDYLARLFDQLGEKVRLAENDSLKLAYLFNAYTTGYIEYWFHTGKGLDASPEEMLSRFLDGIRAT